MDVYSLSDEELVTMLKERAVDVGPIMATTRRVYQKKLERMIAQENGTEGTDIHEEPDDEEEDVDDGFDYANADTQPVEPEYIPEMQPTYSQPERYSPQRPVSSYKRDHGDDLTETRRIAGEDLTTLTRRTLRTTETSSSTSTSHGMSSNNESSSKPAKKGGLSIWMQLLIFLIVAVLIFLVIQNMEPAAHDPVKGIP